MDDPRQYWLSRIGKPHKYEFERTAELRKTYDFPDFTVELRHQANGPGTFQRVMTAIPKKGPGPFPAVAIPFYCPEQMLGVDPETGKVQEKHTKIAMMADLARRGFVTSSADAYHLTFPEAHPEGLNTWEAWINAGNAMQRLYPEWSGIGKLVADTQLLIDLLAADPRVDAGRIGIAGHSLGGKMAFYTGCLDQRIKVILASDFGIGWEQTNWRDPWYWGEDGVAQFLCDGVDHASLLGCFAPKPFCLLAGKFDNEESWKIMQRAPGYAPGDERLKIIHHATGHRPPTPVLEEGYDFIQRWL